MNEKHTYSGDRTKNHFTAYLLEFIKGRRSSYLDKKIRTEKDSFLMEEIAEIEEMRENQERERILLKEAAGEFPEWNELSDEKLVKSLVMLNEKERELIYLHVFEERSFKKIGEMTGMTAERCKDAYFYAIRKIRKRLGDKKDEL